MSAATFLDMTATISAVLLGAAVLLAAFRVARGPSLPDRVLGLDLLTVLAIGFFGVASLQPGSAALADVAFGMAAIGFLATVAFAWFIERRGRR